MRKSLVDGKNSEVLAWLATIRWPYGVACPTCDSGDHSYIKSRGLYQCNGCRRQFNVFTQTPFQGMRIRPINLAEYALWFWEKSANNCDPRYLNNPETAERGWRGPIGIRSLERRVGSYSTAHRLHKKFAGAFENETTTQNQFLSNLLKPLKVNSRKSKSNP